MLRNEPSILHYKVPQYHFKNFINNNDIIWGDDEEIQRKSLSYGVENLKKRYQTVTATALKSEEKEIKDREKPTKRF